MVTIVTMMQLYNCRRMLLEGNSMTTEETDSMELRRSSACSDNSYTVCSNS